jgi:hypothetical protein
MGDSFAEQKFVVNEENTIIKEQYAVQLNGRKWTKTNNNVVDGTFYFSIRVPCKFLLTMFKMLIVHFVV